MSFDDTGSRVRPAASGRDTRQETILYVAARLIHKRGYMALTMRDLADAVGIKMPSVYHHFESKEQILYAIAQRSMHLLIERTVSVLNVLQDRPVIEQLAAAVRVGVRFHIEQQAEAGVVLSEARNLGGDYDAEIRRLLKEYEAIFLRLVQRGIDEGLFTRRDSTMAAYIILSALTRISIWYRPEGRLSPQQVEDEYTSLLIGMVCPAGHERRRD